MVNTGTAGWTHYWIGLGMGSMAVPSTVAGNRYFMGVGLCQIAKDCSLPSKTILVWLTSWSPAALCCNW